MKSFPQIYVFEVEVDHTYPEVHKYFIHQTVFVRYIFSSNEKPNKVKYQPDPMVKEDARIVEEQLKRIGAKVKIVPSRSTSG
jgi:hypothetical protein